MKKTIKILIPVIILIILSGTAGIFYLFDVFTKETDYTPSKFTIKTQEVDDFAYILQYDDYASKETTINDLSQSLYDLLILDLYYNEDPWTNEEMNSIKTDENEKIVVSYISIGEAETYRPYWDDDWDADFDGNPDEGAPSWLDIENPDWEGNYKVKYWDPQWQNIIYGSETAYLDQIIAAGFDGAYLDIIDAYEYYEEQGIGNADSLMVDFVKKLSSYCKNISTDFLIIPQNGEALSVYEDYLEAVDGIGREDILFEGNSKNSDEDVEETIANLERFLDANLFVLQIEYSTFPRFIRENYQFASDHGFICYVGPRDLNYLQLNSNYLPT